MFVCGCVYLCFVFLNVFMIIKFYSAKTAVNICVGLWKSDHSHISSYMSVCVYINCVSKWKSFEYFSSAYFCLQYVSNMQRFVAQNKWAQSIKIETPYNTTFIFQFCLVYCYSYYYYYYRFVTFDHFHK